MNFDAIKQHIITFVVNILKHFATDEALIAQILEQAFPEKAWIFALGDGFYQAENKSPGALLAGVSVPVDIKGTKLKFTSGPA